jgi:nicotinamide riboside kinase
MDYDKIDVDKIVEEVYAAKAEGRTRPMTKQELMRIRLAALSAIVRNMQDIVEKDHELVSASH